MATIPYRIHLSPEEEGGYTVTVPALPGCITYGEDFAHALAMAKEAIEVYLEGLQKLNMPIPRESLESEIDAVVEVSTPADV